MMPRSAVGDLDKCVFLSGCQLPAKCGTEGAWGGGERSHSQGRAATENSHAERLLSAAEREYTELFYGF